MKTDQVFFRKCSSYNDADSSVRDLLASAGFPTADLKGKRVLIKPNLLTDREPEKAVTTNPEVVRPVIRLLKGSGAVVSLADSPASATKLEKVWDKTGFRTLCREEDVELVNAEKAGSKTFVYRGAEYSIANPFVECDALINMPKLKTHVLTSMTAAVKNLYGTIPGYQKAQLHKRYPNVQSFSGLLADIHRNCPPYFNILDGITGMHGEGPSAGKPFNFGFVAASGSAVAMDFALAHLLQIKPEAVPYLPLLAEPLSCQEYMQVVDFVGDIKPDGKFAIETPSTLIARLIPGWLIGVLAPFIWIRPAFKDNCIKCGKCIESCPVSALSFDGSRNVALVPELCIGCCCCHEVCPVSAVQMTQSPLLNFIRKGRLP